MYFDEPGKDNTDQTLKVAADRARELGLTEAVVATSTGKLSIIPPSNLVIFEEGVNS